MRILLANPYRDYDRYLPSGLGEYCKYTAAMENRDEIWQPVEMAYLAGILEERHEVAFIDAHRCRRRLERSELRGYDAVVAGTAPFEKWRCTQLFHEHATDLLAEAAAAGARTVLYGPHPTVDPEAFGQVDAVIVGEPEPVIEEAVTASGRGVFGPGRIASLDAFPEPNYAIFDPFDYDARIVFEGRVRGPFAVVTGTRGCPFNCAFCFKALVSRTMAAHTPDRVGRLAARLVDTHGYKALVFADLTFTLNRRWTLAVCAQLERVGVPYYVSTRVDCLDEAIVSALAASGCVKIELGVETLSEDNLSRMNKRISYGDIERALGLCRKAKIPIISAFRMVFVPGETPESLQEFQRKCRTLGLDLFPNICTPYPRTPLWQDGVDEGKIRPGPPKWEDAVLAAGTVGTSFSRQEVTAICRELAWRSHRPYLKSVWKYARTYGVASLPAKIAAALGERLFTGARRGSLKRYRHVRNRTYILSRNLTLLPTVAVDTIGYAARKVFGRRPRTTAAIEPQSVRKILAIRLDHIGDVLMSTPALRALKERYPRATMTCLVGPWAASIVETNAQVDEIITFDCVWFRDLQTTRFEPLAYLRLARRLRRERFDLCIDFRGDPRHLLLGRLAGATHVVGYGIRGGGFLTDGEPPYREDVHEVERNLDLVRFLGARPEGGRLEIVCTGAEENKAQTLVGGLGLEPGRLKVAICPYSRNRTRWWTDAGFAELACALRRELGAEVVLFGSAEHTDRIEAIRRAAGPGVCSLAGQTTLREFAACLKRMDLVVSIESSPVHFASALGVPIVILFSGTGLPEHWGPYKVPHRIVWSLVPCAPCFRIRCPRPRVDCMAEIRAGDVMNAVRSLVGDLVAADPAVSRKIHGEGAAAETRGT